jgi:hypothetical protein
MRHYRPPLVAVLSVCIVLTGCHLSTEPRVVVRYKPGADPELKTAKYWGEYRLYALDKNQRNPAAGAEPVATVRLAEDEKYGFRRDANGYVVATAADQVIPIEKRNYVWELKPDEAQPDKMRRNLAVFGVFAAVMVLGAVAIWAADPFGN